MWFKFAIVGVRDSPSQPNSTATPRRRVARCYAKYDGGSVPARFNVADSHLAAFGVPLGVDAVVPRDRLAPEHYTFTLTASDGCRAHGFCRRTLPPPLAECSASGPGSSGSSSSKPGGGGSSAHAQRSAATPPASQPRLPLVLVLVAEAPWAGVFFRVLEAVEQLLWSDVSSSQVGGLSGPAAAMGRVLLDAAAGPDALPRDSRAAGLLGALAKQLESVPPLGSVIKIAMLPPPPLLTPSSSSVAAAVTMQQQQLQQQGEVLELHVPPESGTGAANAGIALARLAWHLPASALAALIACLLCERRVVLVSASLDAVTHATAAAAALLHPLRWQHVLLTLLPAALTDYLSAPVPFLAGVHASLLPAVQSEAAGRLAVFDLDLGTFDCGGGGSSGSSGEEDGFAGDCASKLPWRPALEAALAAARATLRSPTEREANALLAAVVQGFYVKLFGGYRPFICRDAARPSDAALMPPPSPQPHAGTPPGIPQPALAAAAAAPKPLPLFGRPLARSSAPARSSNNNSNGRPPGAIAGGPGPATGYYLDHSAFAAATHRRRPAARAFLAALRASQLYEAFVRERLALAAACGYARAAPGAASSAGRRWDAGGDEFEALVDRHHAARRARRVMRQGVRASPLAALAPLAHLQAFYARSQQERHQQQQRQQQQQQQQLRRRTDADFSSKQQPAPLDAHQQAAAAVLVAHFTSAAGESGGSGGSGGSLMSRSHGDLQALLATSSAAGGRGWPEHGHSPSFDGSLSDAAAPARSAAGFTAGCGTFRTGIGDGSGNSSGGSILGRPRSSATAAGTAVSLRLPAEFDPAALFEDSADDDDGDDGDDAGAGGISSSSSPAAAAGVGILATPRRPSAAPPSQVGRSASAADLRQISSGASSVRPLTEEDTSKLAAQEATPQQQPVRQQHQHQHEQHEAHAGTIHQARPSPPPAPLPPPALPKPPAPRFSLRQSPTPPPAATNTTSAAALQQPSAGPAAVQGLPSKLSRMFGALKNAAAPGGGGGGGGPGGEKADRDPFTWLAALRRPVGDGEEEEQVQQRQDDEAAGNDAFAALAARHE